MGVVAFRSRFITETALVMTTGLRISKGSPLNATSEFMIGYAASHRPRRGGGSCGISPSDRRPR